MKLARVTVAREDDLGVNDVQLCENSHVGYLMKSGDVALGYDLREVQFVDNEGDDMREKGQLPDVILLRKLYGGGEEDYKRIWKLERLDVVAGETTQHKKDVEMEETDEEDFMREVESDREMRVQMNLYKSDRLRNKAAMDTVPEDDKDDGAESDDDDQQVKLDELLDNLALDDGPDGGDAAMATTDQWGDDLLEEYLEDGERAAKDGIIYVGKEESRQVKLKDAATTVGSAFGQEFMGKEMKFI